MMVTGSGVLGHLGNVFWAHGMGTALGLLTTMQQYIQKIKFPSFCDVHPFTPYTFILFGLVGSLDNGYKL